MSTSPKQIQIGKTLDVEVVERALAELWQEGEGHDVETDQPVLRSRAANLMAFVTSDASLQETQQTIRDLALLHPCRALVMLADRDGPDSDIEMFVSAFCQTGRKSQSAELCCEEVTLVAHGSFVSELTSAVTPLLVPDLPVFLWWQDLQTVNDDNFQPLTGAADRLVIDSVNLAAGNLDLHTIAQLFSRAGSDAIAVSDISWARLTSWRSLLANFYDVHEYRSALNDLQHVCIDYVAPEANPTGIATQALLFAGWLGSRLHWSIEPRATERGTSSFIARKQDGRTIDLELTRIEPAGIKPGRLAKIELRTGIGEALFVVQRSDDGSHLETHATIDGRSCPGRTLPVRNRSTAQLLSREMEILNRDTTYEDALRLAVSFGQW
jgi:glucose-6-phosphate dehydrogenase assembly protein OpcA